MSSTPITKNLCPFLPPGLDALFVELSALPHLKPTSNVHATVVDSFRSDSAFAKEMDTMQLLISPFVTALTFQTPVPKLLCEKFPTTLTSLDLETGALTESQLSSLPKTLISLSFLAGRWIGDNVEGWKQLPRRLERLYLSSVPPLPNDSSTWLPSTLRELEIMKCKTISPIWFAGLPMGIRLLNLPINLASTPAIPPASPAFPIPRTLTNLILVVTFPKDEREANKVLQEIFVALPPQLEQLTILSEASTHFNMSIPDSLLLLLPKRLTRLYLPGNELVDGRRLAPLLPLSLLDASFGSRHLGFASATTTNDP